MKARRCFAAAALILGMLAQGAAAGLPVDEPVVYGKPEMDSEAVQVPAEDSLELDDSAVPEGMDEQPESFSVNLGGGAPRPGEAAQVNSFTIRTQTDIVFPSANEEAVVNATNPSGNTVITQYTLRLSVAELLRQTGRTGYTQEQYEALSGQPGFNPETHYVELARTKGVAPGSMVQRLAMGALPDGSMLPAGDYAADMVVLSYDDVTHKKSMLDATVKVSVHVLNDKSSMTFGAEGGARLQGYNPVTQEGDIRFGILISQQMLQERAGSPHRTQEELQAQAANSAFDPAYEFLTLYESPSVAPGAFLDVEARLADLPDGQPLPPGVYEAWLVRYGYDAGLGLWRLLDARTQLEITVLE